MSDDIKKTILDIARNNIKRKTILPFKNLFKKDKKFYKEINNIDYLHPLFNKILLKEIKNIDNNNWKKVLSILSDFTQQFKDLDLNLKIPVNLILGDIKEEDINYKGAFVIDKKYRKELKIVINDKINYEGILETINHEFLHYLDYSFKDNKNKKIPASESIVNRECALLRNFQKSIFFGGNINNLKNKYNILNFDAALFNSFLERTLKDNNITYLNNNKIISKNIEYFHNYLNITQKFIQNNYKQKISYNESLSYLHLLFNSIVSDSLYNTHEVLKNFFKNEDVFKILDRKTLNEIKKFILPLMDNLEKENLNKHQIEVLMDNFSLNLLKGNFKFEDINNNNKILEIINGRNIYDFRNIYYTPSLNLFMEKSNGIWLDSIKDNYYFPYHSLSTEKLSFSGAKNSKYFISSYYDLVINKNNFVDFPNSLKREHIESEIENKCQSIINNFIKNNYIEIQNNLNLISKEQLQKKIKNISIIQKKYNQERDINGFKK